MKDMEEWISINLNTILIILGGNIRSCNVEMTDLLHKYKSLVYYGFFFCNNFFELKISTTFVAPKTRGC